jgi:16S rRNA G966 N2-methylase RsmD
MAEVLALIDGPVEPGLVPRGFAEELLSRAVGVDDPEILWEGATTLAGLAQKWNGHGQEKAEIKAAQMFCEIQLGHVLGPSPEHGPGRGYKETRAIVLDGLIPQPRVSELQRFFGWRDALLEEVRNGHRSRRSLLLLVDQWEAGQRPEPLVEELDIRHGDFRDALAFIEPGSVALVLTDPPYPTEYLPLWDALAEWSSEALMSGGSLVAYCGQSILPEALARMRPYLRYWWTLALIHGQSQMLPGKWVTIGWKPLLWFVRDRRATTTMLADTVSGGMPRKTIPTGDGDADWAQSVQAIEPIISALTAPGDLIVDPFAGSGTVGIAAQRFGRRFIGAELRADD